MVLILNKRRSAFARRVGDNENEPVSVFSPETVAEARKSLRKITVYLAERAAVEDHLREYGGE